MEPDGHAVPDNGAPASISHSQSAVLVSQGRRATFRERLQRYRQSTKQDRLAACERGRPEMPSTLQVDQPGASELNACAAMYPWPSGPALACGHKETGFIEQQRSLMRSGSDSFCVECGRHEVCALVHEGLSTDDAEGPACTQTPELPIASQPIHRLSESLAHRVAPIDKVSPVFFRVIARFALFIYLTHVLIQDMAGRLASLMVFRRYIDRQLGAQTSRKEEECIQDSEPLRRREKNDLYKDFMAILAAAVDNVRPALFRVIARFALFMGLTHVSMQDMGNRLARLNDFGRYVERCVQDSEQQTPWRQEQNELCNDVLAGENPPRPRARRFP